LPSKWAKNYLNGSALPPTDLFDKESEYGREVRQMRPTPTMKTLNNENDPLNDENVATQQCDTYALRIHTSYIVSSRHLVCERNLKTGSKH
jgi:hypothetical protein